MMENKQNGFILFFFLFFFSFSLWNLIFDAVYDIIMVMKEEINKFMLVEILQKKVFDFKKKEKISKRSIFLAYGLCVFGIFVFFFRDETFK